MTHKIYLLAIVSCISIMAEAQIARPIKQFLEKDFMKGASFSLMIKDVANGKLLFSYDTLRQMTPASVMKNVTTATALEILGEDYRFATHLEHDGEIVDGKLVGNLYIKGGGDPTLGSKHFGEDQNRFINEWIEALKGLGIKEIDGSVISDESLFDIEGTSMKWVAEDLGSDYGAGCYGISVFDNVYRLGIKCGAQGSKPEIKGCEPELPNIRFHNYLTCQAVTSDSLFVIGAPFSNERYLYGVVPSNREWFPIKGDIPEPALFLAEYLTRQLRHAGISISGEASCYRILNERGEWNDRERREIITTYSPTIKEIVEVTNHVSHNLYADALIKAVGLRYTPKSGEIISSFNRGIRVAQEYWRDKGLDISTLWMYDGSGLAVTSKLSTSFMADLLIFMNNESEHSEAFYSSLPRAGIDGSTKYFLKGSLLHGKARLKSGSMSRVRGYAGYVDIAGKRYAVAMFVNSYSCDSKIIRAAIENLLLSLFR